MARSIGGFKAQRGVTLTESLTAVTVLGVLLGVAVPSGLDMVHVTRLRGAAETLVAELRHAMSESWRRNQGVSVSFREAGGGPGWCYGHRMDSACDCSVAGSCQLDGVDRVRLGSDYPGVTINAGISGSRFSTQPKRSTVTAGNVLFTAANGKQLKVVVTGYGRVRICSPSGNSQVGGYPPC